MLILINPSATPVFLEDLGITLDPNSQIDLIAWGINKADISLSDSIKVNIQNGVLVLNDGASDLTISQALEHIQIETEYEDSKDPLSLPPGGTTGQVFGKKSDADYDYGWIDPPAHPHPDIILSVNNAAKEEFWERVQSFYFEGTDVLGIPTKCVLEYRTESKNGGYSEFRIWDATSRLVVVTSDQLTGEGVYELTNLQNLSSIGADWRLQGKVSASHTEIEVGIFTIKFN